MSSSTVLHLFKTETRCLVSTKALCSSFISVTSTNPLTQIDSGDKRFLWLTVLGYSPLVQGSYRGRSLGQHICSEGHLKENKQMNLGLLLATQQTFSSLIHSVPQSLKAIFGVSQVQGGSPTSINNQD